MDNYSRSSKNLPPLLKFIYERLSNMTSIQLNQFEEQNKDTIFQINGLIQSMMEAVQSAASLVGEGKRGADKGFSHVKKTEDTFAQLWSSSELNHEAASRLMIASSEAKEISTEIQKEFQKLVNQMNF